MRIIFIPRHCLMGVNDLQFLHVTEKQVANVASTTGARI